MLNFDNEITPIDVYLYYKMKDNKKKCAKMLDLGILKIIDNEKVVPYFDCIKTVDEIKKKIKYPFAYQVYMSLITETEDIEFSLIELERIMKEKEEYIFGNETGIKML